MKPKLFEKFCENKLLVVLAYIFGKLIPAFNKLKKYRNIFITPYSVYFQKLKLKNNPIRIRISPTNYCNYRCLFCEIHKDNLLYPDHPKNAMDLNVVKNYESFLSTAYKLGWVGGGAEPLLNKNFGKIVEYLKSKFGNKMMTNTNASVLNRELSDIFIKYGFDSILVSYHAGNKEAYKKLMTGNIELVDKNINYLNEQKQVLGKTKPAIEFNFALHKFNADEYPLIIKKTKQLGASKLFVNKYYGGRNRLQDKKVSYDYDINQGNQVLDEIYAYAKKENINLCPSKPSYWIRQTDEWDTENFDAARKCILPWTNLYFNPVLSDKNCHYVGVCNRIEIFKITYDKVDFSTQKNFALLWNHPVLQYLRKTVNSKDTINPICKNCKNYGRKTLRNTDAQKYASVRDQAVKDFFAEFYKQYKYSQIDGIEILEENPYSDEKFQEKLAELET